MVFKITEKRQKAREEMAKDLNQTSSSHTSSCVFSDKDVKP